MKFFKHVFIIVTVLCFAALFSSSGNSTEEYAERTGSECEACHIDPLGGGEFTEIGKGYLLSVSPDTVQNDKKRGPIFRLIKLIFLYVHITVAFLWFGTILYVHLVLKPAYASKG